MKYKAVLFDMDGTVLDTIDDLCDSMNHCLRKYGCPEITLAEAMRNLGSGAAYYARQSLPEGYDENLFNEFLQYYREWYNTHSGIRTRVFPGIPELISALRGNGVKVGIVSNKPAVTVAGLADEFFPGVPAIGESASVRRKPAPDTVLSMLNEFGVRPEDAVYIGDTEVDITTAQNAGTDCIAVTWGFRSANEISCAPHIAGSIGELELLLA